MGIPTAPTQTPPAGDQANAVVSGSFVATGQSTSFLCWGPFNLIFGGRGGKNSSWNATIRLLRSYDAGASWWVCGIGGGGQQAVWNTPNQDVSVVVGEAEKGMLYALECTIYTSGTIDYRFSATGQAALSMAVASVI